MFIEDNLNLSLKQLLPIIQNRIMSETTYFGIKTFKNPLDAWVYQEILFEVKPDIIIEIGNARGGSTLMLAHICDLIGSGKVIGLDLSQTEIPPSIRAHPRITFIEGDACKNIEKVKNLIRRDEKVLVIEDSSHTYENTLNVLRIYSPLITSGSFFIIEDGVCHHGLDIGPEPGPFEAVKEFLKENHEFDIDRNKESFLITWNPSGYLRKK
jgi:cephalosporin hydroxylase